MQIKYNVTGDRRKALVAVMRDVLQDTTRYLGAPSFAFQVGAYTVDKNGTITCPNDADAAQIDMLVRELAHDGFIGERIGVPLKPAEQQIIETPRKEIMTPTLDSLDRLSVEIPKGDGKMRPLGIPTVADRVAQMVVKRHLEPILEPVFHKDSYGYRPGRSAHDALAVARRRCWSHDWVLDLDIKGFFDNLDWTLLMRALRKHTDCKWVLLYIERWLQAPVRMPDGTLASREKGTPQGGVVTPRTQRITCGGTLAS